MPTDFLHRHKEFPNLIDFISEDTSIRPFLIEKDYWIVHSLYSLRKMEFSFELKGGTSLSKGFSIIDRFSEDIDIRIDPPVEQNVSVNPKQQRPQHVKSRRDFYDWLAGQIKIVTASRPVAQASCDGIRCR